MTDEQAEALGRRYLAAGGKWRRGMVTPRGNLVLRTEPEDRSGLHDVFLRCSPHDEVRADAVPDVRDPATLGCLAAEVRERWGEPEMFAATQHDTPHDEWWVVCIGDEWENHVKAGGHTEAEAWIAALEAAP